jgi:hypothetical protein
VCFVADQLKSKKPFDHPQHFGYLMNRIRSFLFESPTVSLLRYSLIATPLAIIPSVALSEAVQQYLTWLGIDVSLLMPPVEVLSWRYAFGAIVWGPIAETYMLAGLLALLSMSALRPAWVPIASAVLFGALHGMFGALWFFGTVWSFYVQSCAFLVWRKFSFRQAFLVAALTHAMLNAVAVLWMAFEQH